MKRFLWWLFLCVAAVVCTLPAVIFVRLDVCLERLAHKTQEERVAPCVHEATWGVFRKR